MPVRLWLRTQDDQSSPVTLRLRTLPTTPSPPPRSEPIDRINDDPATCAEWLNCCRRGTEMMWRIRHGRHVRARTVEATSEMLCFALDEMCSMIETKRWCGSNAHFHRRQPRRDGWPLVASLELQAVASVHYLCLLRCRIADGAIPADLWRVIILSVLPSVSRFGYGTGGPWVVLKALPPPPIDRQPNWVQDAADDLLSIQDARKQRALYNAWQGITAPSRKEAWTLLNPKVEPLFAPPVDIGDAQPMVVSPGGGASSSSSNASPRVSPVAIRPGATLVTPVDGGVRFSISASALATRESEA